jgi:predicted dehydrogenase
MELVALCDNFKTRLDEESARLGVPGYTDYDEFLKHDMDAVIIATPFPMHAPFAIKALEAGKHVLSETSCNASIAEGVALIRKVEETGLCYMLAENYCYTKFNLEMKRIYESGEIGLVTYAEGEYNHPMDPDTIVQISPGLHHWRATLPPTYYNTHALAPLMHITDTMPVSVNALSIRRDEVNEQTLHKGDAGSAILCRMDNGAVFRILGLFLPGHSNYYRIHGVHGAMEITRGPGYFGPEEVRVWHEPWNMNGAAEGNRVYKPDWPEKGELAESAGHGGGDFWVDYKFAEAIRTGVEPFLNVYRGVAMSNVGIMAWRSALNGGAPVEIPDLRDEKIRKQYENDDACPFYEVKNKTPIPCYTGELREMKPEAFERARITWKKEGYNDSEIEKLLSQKM